MNNNLIKYGLTNAFIEEASLYPNLFLARVAEQHHDLYKVTCDESEIQAGVSGKFSFNTTGHTDYPAVGDWVMIDRTDNKHGHAVIHHVLTRKSMLERKSAGKSSESQLIASNIDLIFICMSLNADFNLRRLERYLSIAWNSNAVPVIVLTKADLCENPDTKLNEVQNVSIGTDVLVCSCAGDSGLKAVEAFIKPGLTVAFIGSSGVGKSTLINHLAGKDILATSAVRDDDKGRHTTTHRQMLLLPCGGIVIDTPGMREIQLDSCNLSKTFEDIEELAKNCKFKDCSHSAEPGCAVKRAIEENRISEERFLSFLKLQKEASYNGLNSRQLENEKIKNMFGSKGEMKKAMRDIKNRKKHEGFNQNEHKF